MSLEQAFESHSEIAVKKLCNVEQNQKRCACDPSAEQHLCIWETLMGRCKSVLFGSNVVNASARTGLTCSLSSVIIYFTKNIEESVVELTYSKYMKYRIILSVSFCTPQHFYSTTFQRQLSCCHTLVHIHVCHHKCAQHINKSGTCSQNMGHPL